MNRRDDRRQYPFRHTLHVSTRHHTGERLQQSAIPQGPAITAAVHGPTRRLAAAQRDTNHPLPAQSSSPFYAASNEHDVFHCINWH